MPFANHYDVVKAFPSNRANHPLGIRVLPRRARRNNRFPDVQRLGLTRKSFANGSWSSGRMESRPPERRTAR
jgi:hypothetical protein